MRDESVRGWSSSGPINLRERWFKMEAVLEFEVWGFLGLLGAVLTYRILTRQFSLQGLLLRKNGSRSTSPERVQLLAATLALSGRYLAEVFHNPPCGRLPDIDPNWLYVMSGSSAVYVVGKALTTFSTRSKQV